MTGYSNFIEYTDYKVGRAFLDNTYAAYTAPYHKEYGATNTPHILTPGLTREEKIQVAIQAYSGNTHISINNHLRRPWNSNSYADEHISCLTELINGAPTLSKNIVVYRGIKGEFFDDLMSATIGETKCVKGFLSTSLSKLCAFSYGNVIKIYVHAGAKAVALDTAWNKSDNELLFLPGRNIKKLGEEINNDKGIVLNDGKVFSQDIIPIFEMLP